MECETEKKGNKKMIRKNLFSIINRLTENNIENCIETIERLYGNNNRHDVTDVLSDLILQTVIRKEVLPYRTILSYCSLVLFLYNIIGDDILISILYIFFKIIEKIRKEQEKEKKQELKNGLFFLCSLENLNVITEELLNSFVQRCIISWNEFDIDIIFIISRYIKQERKDVYWMKQIKEKRKEKFKTVRESFMIEEICQMNIKRTEKGMDDLCFVKKKQEKILKKRIGQLKKVFLVSLNKIEENNKQISLNDKKRKREENSILELAKRMNMNTELRKTIFVSLLLSDGVKNCMDRLNLLSLNKDQQKEISRVIVQCALSTNTSIKFYFTISEYLCKESHLHRISFKYCLWDQIKQIDSYSKRKKENLCVFYSHLFSNGALSLFELKIISFSSLSSSTIFFLEKVLFSFIFYSTNETKEKFFSIMKKSEDNNLEIFIRDLELFIDDFFNIKWIEKNIQLEERECFSLKLKHIKQLLNGNLIY